MIPSYPQPQTFTRVGGAYGGVPEQLKFPTPYENIAAIYPDLSETNAQLSSFIGSQLAGELSPETQRAIQDASARFGVTSGMPGSGLNRNRTVRDLGLATESLQQQGAQNYLNALSGIRNTLTISPELQYGIDERNATLAAAPDPRAAALESQRIYNEYLGRNSRGGVGGGGGGSSSGGGGGGTGRPGSLFTAADAGASYGSVYGTRPDGPAPTFSSPANVFDNSTAGGGAFNGISGGAYSPFASIGYDLNPSQSYSPSFSNAFTSPSYSSGYGVGYDVPGAPVAEPASFADEFGGGIYDGGIFGGGYY